MASPAHAQWKTETYALKGGWNAVYLHGAAVGTPDQVLAAGDALQVQEIWRWNPNANQVQYTTTPLIPAPGTLEWSVWKRGFPLDSNLASLNGQTAYLVKCAGTAASNWNVPVKLTPLAPGTAWLRTGANLLGFPSFKNGANFPLFSNYFATFPAAIAPSTKIFKYVGGDFSTTNPLQILSPSLERLDRNTAYWFDSEIVGNFYAPLEVVISNPDGLDFGKTGSALSIRVTNRSAAAVTLTLAPVASEAAPTVPAGQLLVTGQVPLTRRTLNAISGVWTEVPLPASTAEVISGQTTVELNFGINRGLMSTVSDTYYASLLRLTDSANLMDVYLPARAKSSSLSGLWLGEAMVGTVQNKAQFTAAATAAIGNSTVAGVTTTGVITGLTLKSQGLGYAVVPAVTIAAPPSGVTATATAIVSNGTVNGFTLTNPGSGYRLAPAVTIASPTNPPGGINTSRKAPLRLIMHIDSSGQARVLSQVFLGKLDATGVIGLCTREARLKQDEKATAARLFAAHMPLDRAIATTGGNAVLGTTLTCAVSIPFDDDSNPFVHQYHPDHDNKKANGQPQDAGVGAESFNITRTMLLALTTTPPAGSSSLGWGSTTIGGNYTETLTGLHKAPLVVTGTFELRRVSELGSITTN